MAQNTKFTALSWGLRHANAAMVLALVCCNTALLLSQTPPASRVVGTVKSVSGNKVVVTPQNGPDTTITFSEAARIVRAAPGQTDVKNAPPAQVSDILPGDRIAARVQPSDNNALIATSAI